MHADHFFSAPSLPRNRTIPDLTLLSETLKLSKTVLIKDPCQMASQLIGRLHQIVAADIPVAPGRANYEPLILILHFFTVF